MQTSIQKLTAINQQLAEAKTLDDIVNIRDKAEAVRAYAKSAKLGLEIQNSAAETKIRAERKAGEVLAQMPKQDGGDAMKARSHNVTELLPPTLAYMGIEYVGLSPAQYAKVLLLIAEELGV